MKNILLALTAAAFALGLSGNALAAEKDYEEVGVASAGEKDFEEVGVASSGEKNYEEVGLLGALLDLLGLDEDGDNGG